MLGCVSEIGPNGNYLILNFTRNRKGFISKEHLGTHGGHFRLGEYLLASVLEVVNNKLQLSCMPALVNEGRRFIDAMPGSFINAIATSADEFGYTLSFENAKFTGFVRNGDRPLHLGRVYTLEIDSRDSTQKVLICRLPCGATPA